MADSQIEYVRRSDQSTVPVRAIDIGANQYALAVGIPAGAGGVALKGGTPAVSIVTLTNADTQYTVSVPAGAVEFRARTAAAVRFAFETGKVAGPVEPYATLQAGEGFFSAPVAACTLYLASAAAGTVVEVITYAVA